MNPAEDLPENASASSASDPCAAARRRMVAEQVAARGVRDARVLAAVERVPRHRFVPVGERGEAYEDHPLPIGYGQTISQPYIVALMLEALALRPGARVLEIGTGSGYVAALLAELGCEVFTIEIVPALAADALGRLRELGYADGAAANVQVRCGDGALGWAEAAPFDGIVVAAAAPIEPPALFEQLADGGRLVIPVGKFHQELWCHRRVGARFESEKLCDVRFVPLVRGGGCTAKANHE